MKKQLAFVYRQENCVGCEACTVACQVGHDLDEDMKFRHVTAIETANARGQNVETFLSTACNHCVDPICVKNCPVKAMTKREKDGIVFVDQEKCIGCGTCVRSCPYHVPQIDKNIGKSTKCDMCKDRLDEGEQPFCVRGCPVQVLEIKDMSEAEGLGSHSGVGFKSESTNPSTIFINKR
ncbi:4Fe-4S dicluster domain-containing protein [Shewanella intestini]|uniref:4Fe-4S dicluster domain-containing protein n=1 Tax=Shewanella intestini TaxID=2017544 RepID=A0ABS5I697_9GAMM|nr:MULTISPECIES: 4Fe-4S dicluster domain-containing protein [Shewanella]MBR9729544.1 4Fe-4S dicluster domain-containing protein [Shewanella intestini]MRG37515.1 4Fe-4S dicluster domain-containing protein [Shewanella sp. XMDDZSB0408]